MILKENDTIISTNDINENILKGTVGVILNILEKNKYFLVEFVDSNGDTIGDGMETVSINDIAKIMDSTCEESETLHDD